MATAPAVSTASVSSAGDASSSRRAPRKSKVDALAALNRSRSPSSEVVNQPAPSQQTISSVTNPTTDLPPNTLDMSNLKKMKTRFRAWSQSSRPFGLEECPTFFPTTSEFKDPLTYIRSISAKGQEHGIIKIVPPEGWEMPFVIDSESYRFKTRAMRLNSIEAASRAKINFLEALYRFHRQEGNPRVTVPTINHRPVDLWLLRKEVQKLGGFEAVNKGKKWSELGRLLGYSGIPGLSTQLRNSYIRVILPYEHYSKNVRGSNLSSSTKRDTQTPPPQEGFLASPLSSPLSTTSSPLSEPPDDGDLNGMGEASHGSPRSRRATLNGSTNGNSISNGRMGNGITRPQSPGMPFTPSKDENKTCCEVCHRRNRGTEMLLCDGCDCGFHIFCLTPPLSSIPKGQWFCHTCLTGTGGDYGFDEGDEHSLASFQERDLAFRKMWFEKHPPSQTNKTDSDYEDDPTKQWFDTNEGKIGVTEMDVENEFWRLIQSSSETVEIEYGADVHSTTHGSGMPTLETHPLDPYSKDPWNLNNIPILQDSLLRYIKSEISGMTVPWTYVGMIFSTFCWHNEDHYTHSINYMHWGETKTWYGIPGEDAEKFEAAIEKEAPDLFETQPDLLFQLVTLMSPAKLKESGVRVYACNQRAGEFVITFPKAYHAGFNHGFNFNEAVNFALPDWLPLGRECVKRYREHKKLPVFSHDELLMTISQQSQAIKTAIWLNESFKEMTDDELKGRQGLRLLGVREVLDEQDREEDTSQCIFCKCFCYLSQVVCSCPSSTGKVSCWDHSKYLCNCKPSEKELRLRYSDEEISNTQTAIASRAMVPVNWRNKFNKLLADSPKPQLRVLRALMAEGERINFPLEELSVLKACVNRANKWVTDANSFTTRNNSRKRSKRDRQEKSLADLYKVLDEVDTLGFDCNEVEALRGLTVQAEDLRLKAKALLDKIKADGDLHLNECEALLAHGGSTNVYLEELVQIDNLITQHKLTAEIEDFGDERMTLQEIRQFLSRAKACDLPSDNKFTVLLENQLKNGTDLDGKMAAILSREKKTIAELELYCDLDATSKTPFDPAILAQIRAFKERAERLEKQANEWLAPEPGAQLPNVEDVLKVVEAAEKEFDLPSISNLKRTAEFASDLEKRCSAVLSKRYMHREKEPCFDAMKKWRTYAREHLTKFRLPNFDKLCVEIDREDEWARGLPWFSEEDDLEEKKIFEDVIRYTLPMDDQPPKDEFFTCICFSPVRPPPPDQVSDAVQCDHCFARFHGKCASNGGSCPFCDPNHWNGTLNKTRNFHFCYLPTILKNAPEISRKYSVHYDRLKFIVENVERLCSVIGTYLSHLSVLNNQRPHELPQIRHYLRKLFVLKFAVSPNPEVSFGLDLSGLHRILGGKPEPIKLKKRRRPRFVFGQDIDQDWVDGTRCICRGQTAYLHNYESISCDNCQRKYHAACVCFKASSPENKQFTCPLCCLRKLKSYRWADVRVRKTDETDPTIFVDVKACLETYSRDIIRIKLPAPTQATIFVDLVNFTPGVPDVAGDSPKITPLPPLQFPRPTYPPRPQLPPAQLVQPVASHPPSANIPPPPWIHSLDYINGLTLTHTMLPADGRRKRKYSSINFRNGTEDSNTKQKFVFEIQTADVHDVTTKPNGSNALNIIMHDSMTRPALPVKQSPVEHPPPTLLPPMRIPPASPVIHTPQQRAPMNGLHHHSPPAHVPPPPAPASRRSSIIVASPSASSPRSMSVASQSPQQSSVVYDWHARKALHGSPDQRPIPGPLNQSPAAPHQSPQAPPVLSPHQRPAPYVPTAPTQTSPRLASPHHHHPHILPPYRAPPSSQPESPQSRRP